MTEQQPDRVVVDYSRDNAKLVFGILQAAAAEVLRRGDHTGAVHLRIAAMDIETALLTPEDVERRGFRCASWHPVHQQAQRVLQTALRTACRWLPPAEIMRRAAGVVQSAETATQG